MHSGLRAKIVVLALMGVTLGLTACAKYPVVVGGGMSSPAPSASVPTEETYQPSR